MRLDRLRIFHVAAQQASFTAAAKALHLTQPGVSKHVKELERQYGQPLFDRLGKSVTLTQAGQILWQATTEVFRRMEEAKARIDDLGQASGGQLRVGASNSIGTSLLPHLLTRFARAHPGVELATDIGLSGDIEDRLLDHALDIGLLGHAPNAPVLEAKAFASDRLVLVVPPGHAWAGRTKRVAPAELANEVFLMSRPGSGTRRLIEAVLAQAGVALRAVQLRRAEGSRRGLVVCRADGRSADRAHLLSRPSSRSLSTGRRPCVFANASCGRSLALSNRHREYDHNESGQKIRAQGRLS